MTMDTVDRGPYMKMLDRQALAHQAQFGGSYEQAFTKVFTAPENAAIRDGAKYDELARAFDSVYGTAKSLIPVQKAAPYDPLRKSGKIVSRYRMM
jgi:hypothetical protein